MEMMCWGGDAITTDALGWCWGWLCQKAKEEILIPEYVMLTLSPGACCRRCS